MDRTGHPIRSSPSSILLRRSSTPTAPSMSWPTSSCPATRPSSWIMARLPGLVTRLRTEGVLRNPPIAAPRSDGGFVILDGANRTTALLALEAPAVLPQVVEYEDPAVRLDVWCHLLAQPVDLPGLLRA